MPAATPPDWFRRAIGDGLARLVALGLERTPPAETAKLTKAVWADSLWRARAWRPEDIGRLQSAFYQLTVHSTRWPTPSELLHRLPGRDPAPERTRIARDITPDQRAAASRHIADIIRKLRGTQ